MKKPTVSYYYKRNVEGEKIAIKVKCNNCGKTFYISDNETGENHTCLRCGNDFYVPRFRDEISNILIAGVVWIFKMYIEIINDLFIKKEEKK